MNTFEAQINTLLNPAASPMSRHAVAQSFKHFALSYVCALEGALDRLPEGDPLRAEAQTALDEITTMLMDR